MTETVKGLEYIRDNLPSIASKIAAEVCDTFQFWDCMGEVTASTDLEFKQPCANKGVRIAVTITIDPDIEDSLEDEEEDVA